MQNLGVKNPTLSELLGLPIYKDKLTTPQKLAIVKASLRMGSLINETDINGYHPLQIAIKKGYDEIALTLIQHGADLTFKDRSGYDPFELAVSLGNLKLANAIHQADYPYHLKHPTNPRI